MAIRIVACLVVVALPLYVLAVGRLGLWAYQPWQPALPALGTGLMAVLQPVIVLPLVFWVTHRWISRRPATARAAGESSRSS
jgi:hypothetical protein